MIIQAYHSYLKKIVFLIVDPLRFPPEVELVNVEDWFSFKTEGRLNIKWDKLELSHAESDLVDIELWGYFEDENGPHWDLIHVYEYLRMKKYIYIYISI